MAHWAVDYLGKSWSEQYDCFSFFCEVQTKFFGVKGLYDLKNVPKVHEREKAMEYINNTLEVKNEWFPVIVPSEGDAALFGDRTTFHIGVVTIMDGQNGIVHCTRKQGVIFNPISSFKRVGYIVDKFLRNRNNV